MGRRYAQLDGKVRPINLVASASGHALSTATLRTRFNAARNAAAAKAAAQGRHDLAAKIRLFQFRDTRAKAASEIEDIGAASRLLGHSEAEMTREVYRRVGEKVEPTR